MRKICYLCRHSHGDEYYCDLKDRAMSKNDTCSSFDSIPCCGNCKYYTGTKCTHHNMRIEDDEAICRDDSWEAVSKTYSATLPDDPRQWSVQKIKDNLKKYKEQLDKINTGIGVDLCAADYENAIAKTEQMLTVMNTLNKEHFRNLNTILVFYYWLDALIIACGTDRETRVADADSRLKSAYSFTNDEDYKEMILSAKRAIDASADKEECRNKTHFLENDDMYMRVLYGLKGFIADIDLPFKSDEPQHTSAKQQTENSKNTETKASAQTSATTHKKSHVGWKILAVCIILYVLYRCVGHLNLTQFGIM